MPESGNTVGEKGCVKKMFEAASLVEVYTECE